MSAHLSMNPHITCCCPGNHLLGQHSKWRRNWRFSSSKLDAARNPFQCKDPLSRHKNSLNEWVIYFKRKTPVIWRRFIQITWNSLSISISMPAVYVSMKSLIDSRLLIEVGLWQLNTGFESPLEHRTSYWMRHIKPLFTRKITECSAFRPYWILMDLVMFGLTPSLLVLLFTNCLKHVWTISSNRKGEANYSPQVDLTHWNISLKMNVKNHTYTKLEILVLGKCLLDWESTWTFYQHAVSTKQLDLPARCVPENRSLFCTLFWNILCMISSTIFVLTKLFCVHRLSRI